MQNFSHKRHAYKILTTLLFVTLLLAVNISSQAAFMSSGKIYKTVHADGTVTYSDQASSNATEVQLDVPTSTFQSTVIPSSPAPQINQKETVNYIVTILSPQKEATIRSNSGELSIAASLEPKAGGFFQLHINDNVHESATGMFRLENMNRGAYQYSVKFIDNSGKVIASSESRNVYLHQASALIN
jgi:hypothetical protein